MMVMIRALDRVQADPDQALFLVKGGVAMELRLRQGARATKDLDMVFLGDPSELLIALDDALTKPYSLFSFERGPAEEIGDTGSQRLEVKVQFNGRSWATVRLEVSQPEGRAGAESQLLDAISIEDFGLIGPEKVSCLSMRYQIAQKLHACTESFPTGRDNDRFRGPIDLLLLRALDVELPPIREACLDIFRARREHAWPPALAVPASWAEPYARLASELEFSIEDVDEPPPACAPSSPRSMTLLSLLPTGRGSDRPGGDQRRARVHRAARARRLQLSTRPTPNRRQPPPTPSIPTTSNTWSS